MIESLSRSEVHSLISAICACGTAHFPPWGRVSGQSVRLRVSHLLTARSAPDSAKLARAEDVLAEYRLYRIAPFRPVREARGSIHCGPIVEMSTEGPVILDGFHRLAALLRTPQEMVTVIALSPTRQVPPCGSLRPLTSAVLDSPTVGGRDASSLPHILKDFNPQFFRPMNNILCSSLQDLQRSRDDRK